MVEADFFRRSGFKQVINVRADCSQEEFSSEVCDLPYRLDSDVFSVKI